MRPLFEQEAELSGHARSVLCVEALPDGRLISGSNDHTLKVFDRTQGCVMTLTGHSDTVRCVAVVSATIVVSGSGDSTLRYWSLSDGQCLQTSTGHGGGVTCVVALPGRRIVSGAEDETVKIWSTDGQCMVTLTGHTHTVTCVAVLPTAGHIVSGAKSLVRVWDPVEEWTITIQPPYVRILCVSTLPGKLGDRILAGCNDFTLKLYDCVGRTWIRTFPGHNHVVRGLAVLPGGRHVVSASFDHTLRVWDLDSDHPCIQTLRQHVGPVRCVAVLPEGRIATGSYDHSIRIWVDRRRELEVNWVLLIARQKANNDVAEVVKSFL